MNTKQIPPQAENVDDALTKITKQPKRKYTPEEINEARGNLALMNDRVFMVTFADNKNNPIITGIVDALRKIHALAPIPPIEKTTVQNVSLLDILGRGMVGDLLGDGALINITVEAQKDKQAGYAVRGILTSGNAMRINFNAGYDFAEAPDVIGINILGFRLPELAHNKMFCSRIVRAEYESRKTFLADKYSDYFIELPKMDDLAKVSLPKEYHDLWDLCCIFRAKVKEHEEVIRMQAIANPMALKLSNEVRQTVTPDDFVNDTLNRKNELEQLQEYMNKQAKKREVAAMEKMIIMAIKNSFPSEMIETMRKGAEITETRLAELKNQTIMA